MRSFYVYILTNKNKTVLYTGFPNSLERRVWEHKQHAIPGFTKKYNWANRKKPGETAPATEAPK